MKNKKLITFLIFLAILALSYGYLNKQNTVTYSESENKSPTLPVSNKGIDEVMNRAEFKKQQELLAKEIFLTEEKQRIEAELKAKIDSIEKQLEEVRSQKVSF